MLHARAFGVLSSAAFFLAPGLALAMQRSAPSQHVSVQGYPTPPPTKIPLEEDTDEKHDGDIPEHPTYVTDPKTKVVAPPGEWKRVYVNQQDDIFMRYMPKQNIVMCGCGKCGSTSMLEYTYDQLFPSTWVDTWKGKGPPYVQEVLSEKWSIDGKQVFQQISDKKKQEQIMKKAFSFALIRDPKERLVSAWKSKLACENWYGVDLYDRAHYDGYWHQYRGFVAQVQRLRGQDENITCMSLEMFAEALLDIKKLGRSSYLDRHFLAQDLGCFYRFPPNKWTKVTTIKAEGGFQQLAKQLGSKNSTIYSMHGSPSRVMVTPRALQLLDEVTADEYKMLGPYLEEESPIKANQWSLIREPAHKFK